MFSAATSDIQKTCHHCGQVFLQSPYDNYCCLGCWTLAEFKINPNFKVSDLLENFDEPDLRQKFSFNIEQTLYTVQVDGLQCSSCIYQLEQLPKHISGLQYLRVNLSKNQITLQLDSKTSSLQKVLIELNQFGLKPQPLEPDQLDSSSKNIEKKFLTRIAVAGACAGNIMLFAISIYAGVDGFLKTLFHWLSFFLFLPILFYSASPFYSNALQGLRLKRVSIDLPMAVALSLAFGFSVLNLILGQDEIYFDSTAGFVFLILISRYFNWKLQTKYNLLSTSDRFLDPTYRVKKWNSETLSTTVLPLQKIQAKDVLLIEPEDILPVDGVLHSESACVSTAALTGEALPLNRYNGDYLFAGSLNQGSSFKIEVREIFENTRWGQILKMVQSSNLQKNHMMTWGDRWSQELILLVIAICILFTLFFPGPFGEGLQRSLSLLIVACPCALAFGIPLAQKKALALAQSKGWMIQNTDALENLTRAENLFLDKTGTLTHSDVELTDTQSVSDTYKSIILSLEKDSLHPIAKAFRKAWSHKNQTATASFNLENVQEVAGQGVLGYQSGNKYELKKISHPQKYTVGFFENNELIQKFVFNAPLRQESLRVVEKLKLLFKNIFILSGDSSSQVYTVAQDLGLKKENVFLNLSPEEKMHILSKYPNSVFVGDGQNDVLAMKKSSVSIALSHSPNLALKQSDIYLTQNGIQDLLGLIELSSITQKLIKTTIIISFIYNALAGAAALAGWIGPLEAAILMPISSLLIITTIFWSHKL